MTIHSQALSASEPRRSARCRGRRAPHSARKRSSRKSTSVFARRSTSPGFSIAPVVSIPWALHSLRSSLQQADIAEAQGSTQVIKVGVIAAFCSCGTERAGCLQCAVCRQTAHFVVIAM